MSTTPTTEILSSSGDVEDIADLAERALEPFHVPANGPAAAYAWLRRDDQALELRSGEQFSDRPAWQRGTTNVTDVASFVALYAKHASEHPEVYADIDKGQVTALLNAAAGGSASWLDHRLVLDLKLSDQWTAWNKIHGKFLPQVEFAQFIAENVVDIAEPSGSDMLGIAHSLEAKKGVEFQSAVRLDNGQRQLKYAETIRTKAGEKGDIQVPELIKLGIPVYRHGSPYLVEAAFRYRISPEGGLSLGVYLNGRDRVVDAAFRELAADLTTELEALRGGVIVAQGTPPTGLYAR